MDAELRRIEEKLDLIIEILQYEQLRRAAEKLRQKTQALKSVLQPKEK